MHKGIVLLVEAKDKEQAKSKAKSFLEGYGDGRVWDWYVIGGRWSKNLNPLTKLFDEQAMTFHKRKTGREDVYTSDITKNSKELQTIWEGLGGEGKNPWQTDTYAQDGSEDDIMPLSKCIDRVKYWGFDYIEQGKEEIKSAEKWLNGERGTDDYSMYGYVLEKAGKIFAQEFCFDCNVFNTEKYDYSIPDNIEDYYAVMIDIHN